MSTTNIVYQMNETAIRDAFAVEGVNTVRIARIDNNKATFVASATLYPKGWSIRQNRKVIAREATAEQSGSQLGSIVAAMGKVTVEVHALRRDAKLVAANSTKTNAPAPKTKAA